MTKIIEHICKCPPHCGKRWPGEQGPFLLVASLSPSRSTELLRIALMLFHDSMAWFMQFSLPGMPIIIKI